MRRLLVAMVLVAGFCAGADSTSMAVDGAKRSPLAGSPCAAKTTQTLVATDGMVAERIYRAELEGPATISDRHQVESYGPLLSALAEGDRAGVTAAVVALVYSHTHIVRLRVSQAGKLLSDVGGPYIIAPVGGQLVSHGRQVGSYLLSVQDDLGFVGLETRLIGAPVSLHVGHARIPIEGTIKTGTRALPDRGSVVIRGDSFAIHSFNAKAYPAGILRISLFRRHARDSTRSCDAVKLAEIGRIGHAIWHRFKIDNSPVDGFVAFARAHTGALTYVRSGSRQIAGSTEPGPRELPASGKVKFKGVTYGVTSFVSEISAGAVRVYQLVAL